MDIFFEQIVPIRKTGKTVLKAVGIWLAAALLVAVFLFLMLLFPGFMMIFMLLIFGVFWGGYKLTTLLSVEYEYILTNGDIDVDRITARSSRKRVLTISCAEVERVGRYHAGVKPDGNFSRVLLACNEDDADAYYFAVRHKTQGMVLLIFAPDERMRGAIKTYLPRLLGRDPFQVG